jgi:hypothetical protein
MKKKTILLITLALLLLVGIASFFLLLRNLDSLVAAAIKKYGSAATGTAVRVSSVHISLRDGRGTIKELRVGNPKGFSSNPLFTLGEITIDLDTRSLTSKVPVIEVIRIGAPAFRYELNGKGESNLASVKAHVNRYTAAGGENKQEAKGGKGSRPTRLRIKRLTIEGGNGVIDLSAVGGKVMKGKLPPIVLTDIGGANGITPAALSQVVLSALIRELEKEAAQQGISGALGREINRQATKGLKGLLGR